MSTTVIELVVGRRHDGLPLGALVQLAIREQHEHAGAGLFPLEPQAHADSDAQAKPERTARHFHARSVAGHPRHRQAAIVAAISFEFALRNDAGFDQGCVERDGIVAVRKQEAVTAFPGRIVGPILHRVEVRDCEHVGDVERLRDVALALHLAHAHRVAADVIGAVGNGLIGERARLRFS
jgi:hypothetical protein